MMVCWAGYVRRVKITDFIAARLDDEEEYIDGIRANLKANPPKGASFALGAVRQHDTLRRIVADTVVEDGHTEPDDWKLQAMLRMTATGWSSHEDFAPEWTWYSYEVRRP